jgi:hypothetical protein
MEVAKDSQVIKMPDGGTLIINGTPSIDGCKGFVKIILEGKQK